MRSVHFLVLIIAIFLLPQTAQAWGKEGHEIVAQIALQYVKAPVRKNVLQWLQGNTIEETATWMDDIKGAHINAYMNQWHYINIAQGRPYNTADTPNIVSKLNETYLDLKRPLNESDPKKVLLDLRILFHLTGDLHQPLHVGYGADKGGNQVQVRFGNRGTNLHHVWDTDILESGHITLNECLTMGKTLSAADVKRIRTIDIRGWMNESRSLLTEVYGFKSNKLDEAYIARSRTLIVRQLLYAGIRLAAILDQTFQKQYPIATPFRTKGNGSAVNSEPAGKRTYRAADAPEMIGERIRICGKIVAGKLLEEDKGIVFFFDAPETTSPFSIVIFSKYYSKFPYPPERYLNGKNICVNGLVKNYKGHAEMIIKNDRQIEIQ